VSKMAALEPKATVIKSAGIIADAALKRQKARSVAIALGLVFLIILFYLITIFKIGGNLLKAAT
jgi:hypothetical protein